jgi:hypothetical protein
LRTRTGLVYYGCSVTESPAAGFLIKDYKSASYQSLMTEILIETIIITKM